MPQLVFMNYNRGYVAPDNWDYAAITLSGWNDPFKKITGQYEKSIIEKNLAELLMKMNGQSKIKELPETMKQAIDLFKKTGKWNEAFYKDNKALVDGMGGISKLLKYGNKGLEAVEYIFTDYSSNVETLQMLKNSNINDPVISTVVDEMITKYTDKFTGSVNNVLSSCLEDATNKGIEKVMEKVAGGGVFSVISLASDIITNVSGIDEYAGKLETNAASQIYSFNFRTKYESLMTKVSSGQYTENELLDAEKYFNLTKASLIQEYESGIDIANTAEQKAQLQTDLSCLNNLKFGDSYSNDSVSVGAGNNGGGGW